MMAGLDPTLDHDPLAFIRGGGSMGQLIRSRDWRDSELGPPEQWPATLKSAISMILNSGTAMHVSWGDNLLQFYNDAYTPVLTDSKHPAALGRGVRESYPEIWDFIRPRFERVLNQGEAVSMENAGLMMYRDGVLRECFFSFSYSPLKSLSGEVCGVISVCWETTEEVLARQRERELRLLNEQLVAATSLEEVRHAVRCLVDGNRANLPFLLWYERDEVQAAFRLVKSRGISPDAPLIRHLATQEAGSMLGETLDSRTPLARVLPLNEPATPWLLDPSPAMEVAAIAVEPLCYINFSTPDAYLVFGVSVQRPFDVHCKAFHENICRGIEGAVRRINAVELERRAGQRQFDTVMRLTLDAAQIGYWDLDLQNPNPKRSLQHDRIFGYDAPLAEWSYERFLEHVLPDDRERVDRLFKAALDTKAEWDIECRILRRDGALRWIWIHGDVLTDAAGDAVSTLGIVIDITDRKTTEVAIRESEQRFASAFEHAPIGMALVALDGRFMKVNRTLCDFLGYSETELLTRTFQALTHDDDIGTESTNVRSLLLGEISAFQMEKHCIRANGRIVSAMLSVSLVRDDDGEPRYLIAQTQDNTERKAFDQSIENAMRRLKASEEGLRTAASKLEALSRRLVALQESERKELARELHDRVGQYLTALNINLSILGAELPEHVSAPLRARLADSEVLVEATAAAVRNVVSELRPPMLDDHGLVPALEWYTADLARRTGLSIVVQDHGSAARPSAEVEIALFRIAQEALNNVVKHAGASQVEILIDCDDTHCVMTIDDDGVGPGPAAAIDARHSGLGIVTMRERAQAIGGAFELQPLPRRGTRLSVRAPTP